jgi:heptosyltransferase III
VIAGDAGRLHAAEDNLRLLEPWRDADAGVSRPGVAAGAATATSARSAASAGDGRVASASSAAGSSEPTEPTAPTVTASKPDLSGLRFGGPAAPITVVPPPATALPADIEALLEPAPVVVHVPVMWRYKAWPVESFRQLIATLVEDGHQVVLTGGPSPNDRRAVAEMAQVAPSPRVLDVCGRLDFAQLAMLLRRSALYIGTDTSVTHLAAACSVPTIALFGPTNPMRWGPLDAALPIDVRYAMRSDEPQRRGRVILMQGPGACVPCAGRGCEGHDESRSACLDALLPEQVIAEARAVLGRAARITQESERGR